MKFLTFLTDLPDNALGRALRDGYKPAAVAFGFSLVSNILFLALPLYTYQVYGRVMTSQNQATLWMLTLVTLFAFAVSSAIDDYRARILINYGVALDQRVSGRIFTSLFDSAVRGEPGARAQALRDLDQFRQTLTGIAAAAFFDVPWIPVFLGVLFIIAPLVGVVTFSGACLLVGLAVAQARATRSALKDANEAALKSYAFTDAALRNGEVVRAMGMLPTLGSAWARHRGVTIGRGAAAADASNMSTDIIKAARMGI
jgi:ABC-type protease/lipase transport system fused ATPase/permease subunit